VKIAYGTYAMPSMPLEEAIPTLSRIGYDGIEICCGARHVGSLPEQIDPARRHRLADLLRENRLEIPAMFANGPHVLADGDEHRENLARVRQVVQLARDLGVPGTPVVSVGFGGKSDLWETQRSVLVERLADYAHLAERDDFVLAGEAHVGAAVDRSERILWLINAVHHPRIQLHFDIVHLYLAGETEAESVRQLLPVTAHTHIMDGRRHPDGTFDLLLLGDGNLDTVTYLRAMQEGGWTGHITLEVSVRIWGQDGYDAIAAAKKSYAALSGAFAQAGVPRR